MRKDDRLKIYIIQSHVDKPLNQEPPHSAYTVPIQAGAALTDRHICELNDMDDCEDNLSSLNARYGEASAMYWIGKHLTSPYVGIAHYRRRLQLSDNQLSSYLDQGIDAITTIPVHNHYSITDLYRMEHFSYDWDVLLDTLRKTEPDEYDFDLEAFDSHDFYSCNINVFKSEIYHDYCEWAFPILRNVFSNISEKNDLYQHRDVAFISERLSHLFIHKIIRDHKTVIEAPLIELKSTGWKHDHECDIYDSDSVYEMCKRLFVKRNFTLMRKLVLEASEHTDEERINSLLHVCVVAVKERRHLSNTMYEYLPDTFRSDLDTFIDIWNGFEKTVQLHITLNNEQSRDALTDYISLTHFSNIALDTVTEWYLTS